MRYGHCPRAMQISQSVGAWTKQRSQVVPNWDLAKQPAPDYGVDQRVNW
jgi:hypothetical protein